MAGNIRLRLSSWQQTENAPSTNGRGRSNLVSWDSSMAASAWICLGLGFARASIIFDTSLCALPSRASSASPPSILPSCDSSRVASAAVAAASSAEPAPTSMGPSTELPSLPPSLPSAAVVDSPPSREQNGGERAK